MDEKSQETKTSIPDDEGSIKDNSLQSSPRQVHDSGVAMNEQPYQEDPEAEVRGTFNNEHFLKGTDEWQNQAQQVREGVQGIKDVVSDSPLKARMESLRQAVDALQGEVRSWSPPVHRGTYLKDLEELQHQIQEVQEEWRAMSTRMQA